MIINQLNIKGVSILEPENDPPVRANGDGPEPSTLTLEPVQAIAREVECLRRFRGIERGKDIFDSVDEVCADLTGVGTLEKPFQPPVLKAQDHLE